MIKISIVKDFLGNIFKKNQSNSKTIIQGQSYYTTMEDTINLVAYCKYVVTGYIAKTISQCRLKTYRNNEEYIGEEYYLLNFMPNRNQNGVEFWREFVHRLLYFGEVLVIEVGKELIIAEGFNKEEFAVKETIFYDITRENMTFNRKYKISEVLYINHNMVDDAYLLNNIVDIYAKLIAEADTKFYNNDSIRGALIVPEVAQGDPAFEEQFNKLMNNDFKKFFKEKNGVITLWNGMTYEKITAESKKTTGEVSDRENLLTASIKRTSQLYGVPCTLLTGETMSAITEVYNNYIDTTVLYFTRLIETEVTIKRCGMELFKRGYYAKFEISDTKHTDILSHADAISKIASATAVDDNDIRNRLGLKPYTEKELKLKYESTQTNV